MSGNTELGSGYISIIPSMKGFNTAVFGGLFNTIKTGAAIAGTAIAGVGAATVAIGKQALDAYSDYEQLSGGVKTIFGDASNTVMKDAREAFKTAGVSMNTYMDQLNSFGASLKQSLGGNVQEAARIGKIAIHDMADNASIFGTAIQDVQNAYQGFAKQNYTMLDNLKLGYGGTKTEMERLIADANKLREANGQAGDLTINKFSDVVQAIHEVQKAQGIMGNSAREASETIAGSVQMAKAAWDNLLAGLGDEFISDEELSSLINDFIDSIAIVAENILPVITTIGSRIVESLPGALSKLREALQPVFEAALVYAWNSAVAILESLGIKLPEIDFNSLNSAKQKIESTVEEIKNAIQPIAEAIGNALGGAISILISNIDLVIPGVIGLVTALKTFGFVSTVAAAVSAFNKALEAAKRAQEGATTAQILLNAVMSANPMVLIVSIIAGLVAALITLWVTNENFRNAVIGIWESIKQFFSDSCEAIKGFFGGAWDWITNKFNEALTFISGVPGKIQAFFNVLPSLLSAIFNIALSYAITAFSNIVSNCSNSINNVKNFFGQIPGAVSQAFQSAYNAVREKIDGVVNFVRGAVDKVVGFFKNMRIEIPHIKLPHFSISGKFSLDPPQIPHISVSWYAKGGIFNAPSIIGVGEAGTEAVVPIDKLRSYISDAMKDHTSQEQGASGLAIYIDQFINNDTQVDAEKFFEIINAKLARNGVVLA